MYSLADSDSSEDLAGSLHLSSEDSDLFVGSLLGSQSSDLSPESLGLGALCLSELASASADLAADLSDLSAGLSRLASDLSAETLGGSLFLLEDLSQDHGALLRADLAQLSHQLVDLLRGAGSGHGSSSAATDSAALLVSSDVASSARSTVLDDSHSD